MFFIEQKETAEAAYMEIFNVMLFLNINTYSVESLK